MTRIRFAIRLTALVLTASAPLTAHAVMTRALAANPADLASTSLASGRLIAHDSGPAPDVYFGRFTMDDAVLRDDGQPLAAAVRGLALQISGEYVAAYPRRAFADFTVTGHGSSAGGPGNPSSGFGHGYLGLIHDRGGPGLAESRGLQREVPVTEPPTISLIALGLGMMLLARRRRAADSARG
jgi:hypothetical protein